MPPGFQAADGSGWSSDNTMTDHVEAAHRCPKNGEEGAPVDVVQKNGSLGVAPGCHMIDGSRKFCVEWSGHGEGVLRNFSRFKI